ncbi:MAG: YitT family protein [Clostridium sp.]|nr:YitT family protein [Clostridium sp.]
MKRFTILTLACLIYGIAVSLFLDPNDLAPGGVTGLSVILGSLKISHVPTLAVGTWILILNIPILALGIRKFGLRFLLSTLYCTAMTSLSTNLFAYMEPITNDPLLAALCGGSLMAIALGLVFLNESTTGGIDIVIKLLKIRYPYLKTGFLFLMTDAVIVLLSGLFFRNVDVALYAGLCAVTTSYVMDLVLYGRDGAKLIYIISDRSEAIAQQMLSQLQIGVTYIEGFGAYSQTYKKVILCAVKKQISPKVETIVKLSDPQAFMIISRATEVYGIGYKRY